MSVNVWENANKISTPATLTIDIERCYYKALNLAATGEFDQAIQALHEITKSIPTHHKAWTTKAMLYRMQGDIKMADLCERTARNIPNPR